MVFLDVVYNHLARGKLPRPLCARLLHRGADPWGSAIDYRVPQVRAFAIENAMYGCASTASMGCGSMRCIDRRTWRNLDAARSQRRNGDLATENRPSYHLVLENDDNRVSVLDASKTAARQYRAQWNDDYHHAWHVLLTARPRAITRDFQRSPLHDIARALGSRLCLSGRGVSASRRHCVANQRELAPTASSIFAEPRPDRKPRLRRPARKHCRPGSDRGGAGDYLVGTGHTDVFMAKNGARRRRFRSLRFQGDLAEAGPQGPAPGIRLGLCQIWRRRARSAGAIDISIRRTGLGIARHGRKKRLALVRELLSIRAREIVPRLAGARFGDAHAADDGLLTANWRLAMAQHSR